MKIPYEFKLMQFIAYVITHPNTEVSIHFESMEESRQFIKDVEAFMDRMFLFQDN